MSDLRVPGRRALLEDANVGAARQGMVDARGVGPSGRYRLRGVVELPGNPHAYPPLCALIAASGLAVQSTPEWSFCVPACQMPGSGWARDNLPRRVSRFADRKPRWDATNIWVSRWPVVPGRYVRKSVAPGPLASARHLGP